MPERSGWNRFCGSPGPGETALLNDGYGFDSYGSIAIYGEHLVVRRRDDPEGGEQHILLTDIRWLLSQHGELNPTGPEVSQKEDPSIPIELNLRPETLWERLSKNE